MACGSPSHPGPSPELPARWAHSHLPTNAAPRDSVMGTLGKSSREYPSGCSEHVLGPSARSRWDHSVPEKGVSRSFLLCNADFCTHARTEGAHEPRLPVLWVRARVSHICRLIASPSLGGRGGHVSRAGDAGGRRTVTGGLKRVTGRPTAKRKPGGRLASRAWLGLELMAFRGPICGARHLAQASFRCREERTGGQGDRKLGEGLAERRRREVTGAGGGGERPQGDGAGRVAAPESGHGTLRESL